MRYAASTLLALLLVFGVAGSASADTVIPTSPFGGTYYASSADGSFVAFQTADGRIRWEFNGTPLADWGVNEAVMASSVGFSDARVLVPAGRIRGSHTALVAPADDTSNASGSI